MVVLAAIFFFQKTASRQASLILAVLGAAAITGAFTFAGGSSESEAHHDAAIAIAAPEDGATVEAGTLPVQIELTGAELAGESSSEDAGHVHVYVDGKVVDMPSSLDVEVDMEPGEHELAVEFVDAGHAALDPPVTDSVTITAE
jgi:hypothetical protein